MQYGLRVSRLSLEEADQVAPAEVNLLQAGADKLEQDFQSRAYAD